MRLIFSQSHLFVNLSHLIASMLAMIKPRDELGNFMM